MVLLQHSGKVLDIQFPVRLSTELQGRYPFLKVIDIVIQIVDKGLRVDAFPVFPQPQMEVWPRRFSCISRDRYDVTCLYHIILINGNDTQMPIQTLDASMLENDIVPIASGATMNLLDDTWHHGIDIAIVAFQVYTVMETLTSIYRILSVAVSGVDGHVIQGEADRHPLFEKLQKGLFLTCPNTGTLFSIEMGRPLDDGNRFSSLLAIIRLSASALIVSECRTKGMFTLSP